MREQIRRFEQLIAWQRARELTKNVYLLTATERFSRDFGLRDQIQRAAVSITSNIAEGFERAGKAARRPTTGSSRTTRKRAAA